MSAPWSIGHHLPAARFIAHRLWGSRGGVTSEEPVRWCARRMWLCTGFSPPSRRKSCRCPQRNQRPSRVVGWAHSACSPCLSIIVQIGSSDLAEVEGRSAKWRTGNPSLHFGQGCEAAASCLPGPPGPPGLSSHLAIWLSVASFGTPQSITELNPVWKMPL